MTPRAEQVAIAYGIRVVECERKLPSWLTEARIETAHAAFEAAMGRTRAGRWAKEA